MGKMDDGEFEYIVDKKIMKIPPIVAKQVVVRRDDAVCDLCWRDLWFQMVFFYRREIRSELPNGVGNRPACYWGINCNTMDHNDGHASRFDHMVYQSRF
jgi:E3 ubiquitin-protein ligase CHFR